MHNKVTQTNQSHAYLASNELQSATIDLLRFPLVIMVIFIHISPDVINLFDADFELLSGHGIYNVVEIIFSHVLPDIAVPVFFLISGFLFFINFQEWSWDGYKKKLHSRIKTLIIPYFLWNVLSVLMTVLSILGGVAFKGKNIDEVTDFILKNNWHFFYDCSEWGTTHINWLGDNLRMTGPFLIPLWFLRDLIVVTVLTPIIYYAIKKLKFFVVAILFLACISRIWTLLPGFQIIAFFYFTTGAYFALNRINIVNFSNKYKMVIVPVCIFLLIATTVFYDSVTEQNLSPLFVCSGVFATFIIASNCITKYNIRPNKLLVSSCFFIYAVHNLGFPLIGSPLSFTRMILHKIIPGNSGIEDGFCYLVSPFATAIICIAILIAARRILPQTTLLFSGNK